MQNTLMLLILLECANTQVVDNNQRTIYDVRCENNATVVYNHSNQQKLYVIKNEGNYKVLRDYKTQKVILKEKVKK